MIRFAPDPTPELRAARQAVVVGLFLRALGPSSSRCAPSAALHPGGPVTAVPNWRSAGSQPASPPAAVGGLTDEERRRLAELRGRVEVVE